VSSETRKLLFIAWDGPHVTYMEGLFLPILARLQDEFEIHVVQFSWQDEARKERLTSWCKENGVKFVHRKVGLKPLAPIGKYISVWRGAFFLLQYIWRHRIDIVMPRSTMPARMIQIVRYFNRSFKLVFDADGLPIEERVEFAGLRFGSLRYKALKRTEKNTIGMSDIVLTRSRRAADYLSQQHHADRQKFAVVSNGRDIDFFKPVSIDIRNSIRNQLGLSARSFVLIYVGSMGPQYGVEQMIALHQEMRKNFDDTFLLLISPNVQYLKEQQIELDERVRVISAPFAEIVAYLSVGNVALAIRRASPAMMGVAPIKIGEYLLMGLPVIASAGIGDTEDLLKVERCVHILPDYSHASLKNALNWIMSVRLNEDFNKMARKLGEERFSIEQSVRLYKQALRDASD
jgi:glycosyltransferase involved in cell wall biosynthesis